MRGEGNGLEVKIGNITSDQGGEYHIGNYNVNISGTTEQEHRAGLAFFGLSAEGSDTKVTVDNFSLKNNFLIGNKYTHNNTALYVGGGADVSVNGNVYIRSEVEHTKQGEDATLANNGIYARGAGSTITANGGDVYINTYASNFKELPRTIAVTRKAHQKVMRSVLKTVVSLILIRLEATRLIY